MSRVVEPFFHEPTNTACFVVAELEGSHCAIIDSVLDFDAASGRTSTEFADRVVAFVENGGLEVDWILETHAHADHLTAAPYLKERLGGAIGIGERIVDVQKTFSKLFNCGDEMLTDGSQFDHLFKDDEVFTIGSLSGRILHTPGHTPACVTYVLDDAAFVGDTIFMPDFGTARTDFPGGDAVTLYRSIQRIFALPPGTRLFVCHDYKAPGRDEYAWETTVAEERESNLHIHDGVSEDEFVSRRMRRDAELAVPRLLLPSIQVNMRAGTMPPPESNGVSYLKIPINGL